MKKAIFPGTFDPFTIGHYDIVKRGLELFDEIIIAIGINQTKKTLFNLEKRIDIIEKTFSDEKRVKVITYKTLTVDLAKQLKAKFILRGVRNIADFEYEQTIAQTNKQLEDIETVILFTDSKHSFVSSSLVRELMAYNKDISRFIPTNIED